MPIGIERKEFMALEIPPSADQANRGDLRAGEISENKSHVAITP